MALPKIFRSVTQISEVAEGATQAFTVDYDNFDELAAALHAKLDEKEAPILPLQTAIAAARANLPPHP